MPWMSLASIGTTIGSSGALTRSRPTAPTVAAMQHVSLPLPSGVNITTLKGQSVEYRNRWINVGCATDNMIVDEHFRAHRLGIQPPTGIVTIAAAAGPGITASTLQVGITFRDSLTGERSAMSGLSSTIALANQAVAITVIPITSNDARVDEVEFWHIVDGAAPRLATRRQLGVAAVTENVATLSLGEAFAVTFSRLPRAKIAAIYHERLCLAGDARHPDILYCSGITFPERWEGLSFRTRNGEPIIAIIPTRTILLVLCPHSSYALRGWTEDDMVMEQIDGDFGTMNAYTPALINGSVWGADADGPWLFNGGFHRIMRDRTTEWRRLFRQFGSVFENSFGVANPNDETYRIYMSGALGQLAVRMGIPQIAGVGIKTIAWVASYDKATPEISGEMGQPDWVNDVMERTLDCGALLSLPGAARGDLYLGGCDGKVRVEIPDTDPAASGNDDSDLYTKMFTLRTGAFVGDGMGGDKQEQKSLLRLWSYLVSEEKLWTIYVRGGQEECCAEWTSLDSFIYPDNVNRFYKHDPVPPSGADPAWNYEPETVTVHGGVESVSGRTFTFEWRIVRAVRIRWAGYGGLYGPGVTDRFPVSGSGSG